MAEREPCRDPARTLGRLARTRIADDGDALHPEILAGSGIVRRREVIVAWIETIRENEWTGHLADLYPDVADRSRDRVDNIMQIHSLNPRGLVAHDALYRSAMRGTATLRKVDRELIAMVVSAANDCHY
jgi:alkylhydroperoxidase family enzyme